MNIKEAGKALSNTGFFRHWMGNAQRMALLAALRGEEGEYFAKMLTELQAKLESMPKTYEQDGLGEDAVVHLHYFRGSVDAWITEKDMGDESGDLLQLQAFGKITLTGDKDDAELGYISIQELIDNGVELDLYWTPKPLKECRV